MLLLLVPIGLATVVGLFVLWPSGEPTRAQQAAEVALPPGTTYPEGEVVSVETYECGSDPAVPQQCATAVVEILDGEGAGDFQSIELAADVVANGVEEGDTLVLTRDAGAEGGASYGFFDYARGSPIVVLAIAFAVVVGLVARLRGLASLVGLAFAFFILFQFVLPAILSEDSPTLVSLVGSSAIMFVVLYLAHGFSARTTTALVGTLFGLTLVAVLGSIAVSRRPAHRPHQLRRRSSCTRFDPTLNFSGLVLAGVVVAGPRRAQRRHHHPGVGDLAAERGVAGDHLARAVPARHGRGPRPHRLDRLHDRLRLRRRRAARCCCSSSSTRSRRSSRCISSAVAEEVIRTLVAAIALVLAVPVTTAVGAFFAKAAGTEAGAATERRMTALRARFAR